MKKVTMVADGVEPRVFELTHAQATLDFEKSRGLSLWKVEDPNYTVVDGTIKPVKSS